MKPTILIFDQGIGAVRNVHTDLEPYLIDEFNIIYHDWHFTDDEFYRKEKNADLVMTGLDGYFYLKPKDGWLIKTWIETDVDILDGSNGPLDASFYYDPATVNPETTYNFSAVPVSNQSIVVTASTPTEQNFTIRLNGNYV
jgi:chromosome condensin MukBEF MukE localization factor